MIEKSAKNSNAEPRDVLLEAQRFYLALILTAHTDIAREKPLLLLRACDPSGVRVSGGRFQDPLVRREEIMRATIGQRERANEELNRINAALGLRGVELLRLSLLERCTNKQIAAIGEWQDTPGPGYVGARLNECLATIASELGLT